MIDDDIRKIINKRPVVITNFLRAAKNLKNEEWEILTKKILDMDLNLTMQKRA
jgi:hypothetical protein